MEQLSVYEEAETTSQDTTNESGQNQPQVGNISYQPDIAQDGDPAPPSSIPAGPVTCHQDPSSDAPSPALAGPTALEGILLCLCHLDAVHPPPRRGDYPGAVVHPLAPGGCPLIAAATPPAPGPLLPF